MSIITAQNHISGFIENRKYYWKIDRLGKKLEEECKSTTNYIRRSTLFFVVLGYMVFAIYSMKMFFSETIDLPITCYIPEGWPLSVLIPLQLFTDFNLVTNMLVCDVLFATFSCDLLVQLKLLSYSFFSIDYENIKSEADNTKIARQIGESVDLHNVITK